MNREDICHYCGVPATEQDHVIPRKWQKGSETVPVCLECNRILRDYLPESLEDRKQELKLRLARKYYKLLNSPDWTEQELQELGSTLRSAIKASEVQKQLVKLRLEW